MKKLSSFYRSLIWRFGLLLIALLTCAAFVWLTGDNPLLAARALLNGALGSPRAIAESLAKTTPLILTGLSVVIGFRAGFFNIGAEGQFLMGALIATALGTKIPLPWPLVLIGGALAGASWSFLAGWLKLRRGAPEIITTIMLNYVAIQLVAFSLQIPDKPGGARGWLLEKEGVQPLSDAMQSRSQLPSLMANTNLHAGLFLALLCAGLCWWFLFRSERGFLARASGVNPLAARAAGIETDKQVLFATALCGALAGLGGAMEIAGATRQLGLNPPGYGYTAIAVALLGDLNPLGVLPSALLFGILSAGGGAMERNAGVPAVTVSLVIGVLICCAALLPRLKKDT
jgi:simple sugar transport system permease protein